MDETFSLDALYENEYVHEELYQLARTGSYSELNTRLHNLPNVIDYLTTLTGHNQGQLSLLMVAALHGYDEIVRLLLTDYDPTCQVELKGVINISDETRISGATALYCACYCGHFTVAKTLIDFGKANINQDTNDYPYFPLLLHATVMNRLDIVQFLIENKYADVNETKCANSTQCTSLICAAWKGYVSLVEYLIKNGADVNYSCIDSNGVQQTPVLLAACFICIESIQLLYKANANMKFISKTVNPFPSNTSMNTVFELLKFALQYRQSMAIEKICIQPIAAYNYEQECQTIDELNSIEHNDNRIRMEILLIQERCFLSRKDRTMIKLLQSYGDMLAVQEEFEKYFEVLIHTFYLCQHIEMETILHKLVRLFCKMLSANQAILVERFLQVCQLVFEPWQMQNRDHTLVNAFYLVIIASEILKQQNITQEERTSIYYWISRLCHRQLSTENGRTILHLCVDDRTNRNLSFISWDMSQYLRCPNVYALRLLLSCGLRWLDLDAVELSDGNTPLHVICRGTKNQEIIKLLLNSGCHVDCVNKHGKTPLDYLNTSTERAVLQSPSTPTHLKCLCARFIARERLDSNELGSSLKKFVLLHGVQ